MLGVLHKAAQTAAVEEFFELFKTPWEFYQPGRSYDVLLVTTEEWPAQVEARLVVVYCPQLTLDDVQRGVAVSRRESGAMLDLEGTVLPVLGPSATFDVGAIDTGRAASDANRGVVRHDLTGSHRVMRVGLDLFDEVARLLSEGQPVAQASLPTLDRHIALLRSWIVAAGVALLEIPPVPAGHEFAVCLTHDIDFIGIRQHRFDHSMWGFLYRSTVGVARSFVKGRMPLGRVLQAWRAAASLPFVYLGWAKDFWEPFGWYLRVEKGLPATYYLIPFKGRAGEHVPGAGASRRATAYDVTDLLQQTAALEEAGCELGVHGIDAWHRVDKAREELQRLASVTRRPRIGTRMHWLLFKPETPKVLEQAGYAYDSTAGYNETVGYRNGTTQVYRPFGATTLLELPMHIQDGALFYPTRLNLTDDEAWERCAAIMEQARVLGGVVTLLWHDRSHGPERFWGDFYVRLIDAVRASRAWVGSAGDVVAWFGARRAVRFEANAVGSLLMKRETAAPITPPLTVRMHRPARDGGAATFVDRPWDGNGVLAADAVAGTASVHETEASGHQADTRPSACSYS